MPALWPDRCASTSTSRMTAPSLSIVASASRSWGAPTATAPACLTPCSTSRKADAALGPHRQRQQIVRGARLGTEGLQACPQAPQALCVSQERALCYRCGIRVGMLPMRILLLLLVLVAF